MSQAWNFEASRIRIALSFPIGIAGAVVSAAVMGLLLYSVLQTANVRFFEPFSGLSEIVNAGVFALQLSYILSALSFGFIFAVGLFLKQRLLGWFTESRSFRIVHLTIGAGVTILAAALGFALEWTFLGAAPEMAFAKAPGVDDRLVYAGLVILAFLLSASAEELFFRSYMLRAFQRMVVSPYIAIIAAAAAFSILHSEFATEVLAVRFISGLALGWSAWRLGGIEFAIGAHAAGNLMLAFFTTPMTREGVSQANQFDVLVEAATALALIFAVECLRRTTMIPRK